MDLYAELQLNPRNLVVYRKLVAAYRSQNMKNEADAFDELIHKKYNVKNPDINSE